jgi:hypothetical protein
MAPRDRMSLGAYRDTSADASPSDGEDRVRRNDDHAGSINDRPLLYRQEPCRPQALTIAGVPRSSGLARPKPSEPAFDRPHDDRRGARSGERGSDAAEQYRDHLVCARLCVGVPGRGS